MPDPTKAQLAAQGEALRKSLEAAEAERQRLEDALAQALEQQTATSDILRVIANSPTDYQPVFNTIVARAGVVCGAVDAILWTVDGDELVTRAHHGPLHAVIGARQPIQGSVAGYAVREARTVQVEDLTESDDFPVGRDIARRLGLGWRTTLSAPLVRDGIAIGAILIRRNEVCLFTEKQIGLLQTFADQAVIAIENVRLFTELQQSNRELTTALDTQTATADILRVISASRTDVQPVFETIVASAKRLLEARSASVLRLVESELRLAAFTPIDADADAALQRVYPRPVDDDSPSGIAARERVPFMTPDARTDARVGPLAREAARARGYHAMLIVPMVRKGDTIGTINVSRATPGPFADKDIALLQTFADQAVIAIENVRLFNELEARTQELTRSVDELTALGEVSRTLSSTLDLETVLQTIVTRAVQIAGTAGCNIWEYDEHRVEFRLRASHYADHGDIALLQAPGRVTTIPRGQGVTTQVIERREPVQIADIAIEGSYESPIRRPLIEAGHRALLGVPLLSEDEVVGVLAVTRKTPGAFEPEIVRLLSTFATQSALAIQNARLFLEIEDKSRQLEAASQHKSEFLANMSHELRTPLNAIIGFSDVLLQGMFGDMTEKQTEYLQDILASGQHLLSLINDILDLSKIEAGRMDLDLAEFDLPSAIDDALLLMRERASRRGLTLERQVDERLGEIRADQRKVKQVLLNLLSNAVKFTPEGGRIDVRAALVDRSVEMSVTDTGIGIAPEDQEAVFEEFRQVGKAEKKAEGTGLGLALCRKFVELHGGRIWVKSEIGAGSTFTFSVPVIS